MRYESEDSREMVHPITGNVFLTDDINHALESVEEIKHDVFRAIRRFSHRAQSMIASRSGPTAYIYIPNVKHLKESGASRKRVHLDILDDSGKCEILIPPSKRVNLPQYKNVWFSDVVLGFYALEVPLYELSVFLRSHVTYPQKDLGKRIFEAESKGY